MFHRVAAVVAVTTLTLLALGGCGGGTASTSSGGAPSVTGAYGNTPNLTIPTSAPPSELTSTLLSRGAGARVNRGDLLVANYLGQTWKARKEFDSSFRRGQPLAFPIGVGQVIKGWDTKLVGVPIGSRVLLAGVRGGRTRCLRRPIRGARQPRSRGLHVIDHWATSGDCRFRFRFRPGSGSTAENRTTTITGDRSIAAWSGAGHHERSTRCRAVRGCGVVHRQDLRLLVDEGSSRIVRNRHRSGYRRLG
jgi:hypothetical protein